MSIDQRKVQLGVEVDDSGAQKGFDRVESGAKKMAQSVAQSGKQAGTGIDAIGAGGEGAAEKLDRSTSRILSSIQRTTAAMQAGGRDSVDYFKSLASDRGANMTALQPALDKLGQAIEARNAQLKTMGVSAAQTANALRGVPAQFTDIAVSLSSGQNPMTVFLQQGGQLKDMFGSASGAARALGGYVLGLINPVTIAAAAATALGAAFYQGSEESKNLSKALILTGNAANTTVGGLYKIADGVAAATGATKGQIAEVIQQVVASGKVAGDNIGLVAAAAINLQRTAGQATEKTVQQFAELGKSPVEASLKLNEQYRYLTAEIYTQIKALSDQGREIEAAAMAQKAFADASNGMASQIKQNLGFIETAWTGVKDSAKSAWDAMLGMGREKSLNDQLADVEKKLAQYKQWGFGRGDTVFDNVFNVQELEKQKRALEAVLAGEKSAAEYFTEQNKKREAGLFIAQKQAEFAGKQKKMADEIAAIEAKAAIAGTDRLEVEKLIASVKEKYTDKAKSPSSSQVSEGQRLIEQLQGRLYAAEQLGEVEKLQEQLADGRYKKMSAGEQEIALALAAQIDQRALIRAQLDDELASVKKVIKEYDTQDARLKQLIGATPGAKNQQKLKDESLAESALWEGKIDQTTFDQIMDNLNEVKKTGKEVFSDLTTAINQWGRASAEAIVDFVVDGKASFSDMANSFIKDIARIVVQQNITTPIAKSVSGMDFGSFFSGLFANANGGVYASPSLSALSGKVYDSPQFFALASGAAVLGEAGPEAVMPLSRGSDGKLGVRAESGLGNIQININNTMADQAAVSVQPKMNNGVPGIEVLIQQVLANDMSRNGPITQGLSNTFGMMRSV